ncbi:mevalonate kinase [Candidatus Daviesbacteria bacterium]|nr:mevalonate kinase [Candidatus Daviesbacteria bacterium]
MISFSAPGKIHLLGEHAVVYGKPAVLAAIDLRVHVKISPSRHADLNKESDSLKKIIEPIVKKELKIKKIPPYDLKILSEIPVGSGLGSSAAVSSAYIAAILSFLNVKWNLELVNNLAYEAEKVFHGNPSGADNFVVVYGGVVWFHKQTEPVKLSSQIKQFMLIDSGKPVESTKEMVEKVRIKLQESRIEVQKIFDDQERLVKELVVALKDGNQNQLISIIRQGEKNLESLGVVGRKAQNIIRLVEKTGGVAKISGAGGVKSGSGMLLCYHPHPKTLLSFTKTHYLPTLSIALGEKGLLLCR